MTDTSVVRLKPEVGRDLGAAEARIYTNIQIPYPNLAGNQRLAERAANFAQEVRQKWEGATTDTRLVWKAIDYLFNGNSLFLNGKSKSHVPEILKAHRSIVPRLIEAFLGNGEDWFMPIGQDADDRRREAAIGARLETQLNQNRFAEQFERAVDCLTRKAVMGFKVYWDRTERKQVYHWIEQEEDEKGNPVDVHKRQFRKVIPYEGNRVKAIDPYRLLVDTQRADIDDLDYVGDFDLVPLDEVLANPNYKNLEVLRERAASDKLTTGKGEITQEQVARGNLTSTVSLIEQRPPQGGRRRVELMEIWGWFDFNTEPGRQADMREAKIVVADGNICIELRENYHDDKHRPYALGKFSQEGFEFYPTGLYVPALGIQDEMDHFRGVAYDAADVSAYPRLAVSGPGGDLPSSILDLPQGAIMRDVGNVSWQPAPNTLQHVPLIDSMMRRDVEEVLGVPRIWQGTESAVGGDSTATEIRRKIEEGNRRLMGIIRAADAACVRMLQIMHANDQQFITDKTKYRTLNKSWAKILQGRAGDIRPVELTHSVDFVIHGVKSLKQYGLRGTNLMTFAQMAIPLMQENPGLVNTGALLLDVYKQMVGEQQGDPVINVPTRIEDLEDQTTENRRLRQGIPVPVDPLDDDEDHIAKMEQQGILEWAASRPNGDMGKIYTLQHYADHIQQAERKAAQEKVREREEQKRARSAGVMEDDVSPPAGGLERPARETPGPGTPGQVSRGSRAQPIEQDRN